MAKFEVRVRLPRGAQTYDIDAPNQATAERIASKRGKLISIRKKFGLSIGGAMSPSDRYTFLRRLASLVGSRMGTAEALRQMALYFSGSIRGAAQGLLQKVEAGMDLPSAMDSDRKNFPVATVALIKAGTTSGETWRALKDAADFEYQMQTIMKGSLKEMSSAIMSFLIAGALMISTTKYFGPMVMDNDMFKNSPYVQVDWIQSVGDVLTLCMIGLMTVFFTLLWFGTLGRAVMPNFADKVILRVPYYKDLILSRNNYVTLYKLGLLISSGVRIEEALALTEAGSPKGALKTDLSRAVHAVKSGKPWATVMETLHPADRAALSLSTNRKDIAWTMDLLASQYKDLYVQRITSFAPLMQLISALFMTLAGGVLFGLTILPMLQLAAGMSGK